MAARTTYVIVSLTPCMISQLHLITVHYCYHRLQLTACIVD